MTDPAELRDFLAQARADYLQSLDGRFRELERLLSALESGSASGDDWNQLVEIVHRIRGSSGSFGLDAIGDVAAEWEQQLRASEPVDRGDCTAMRECLSRLRSLRDAARSN